MRIPRVVEARLAKDWVSPWTGNTFTKDETIVQLQSELIDKLHGKCLVSLPNPVPAYLNIVEDTLETALQTRNTLYTGQTAFPKPNGTEVYGTFSNDTFDQYFQLVAVMVTVAFMALEAWCNQMIPEDYIYKKLKQRKVLRFLKKEINMHKSDIERWISLDDKLTQILPLILTKSSFKSGILWQRYKRTKKIRDELTHLKSPKRIGDNKTNYDPFFQRILNLDLNDIAGLPKDIMKYFVPNDLGF